MAYINGTNLNDNNTFTGSWPFVLYRPQINGTDLQDYIYGLNGSDILYGNGGNDYLDGGTGADIMYGGLGNDNFVVDNGSDVVVELADYIKIFNIRWPIEQGSDHVYSWLFGYKLPEHVESLTLMGNAFVGDGNSLDNYISGNNIANIINGYEGKDNLGGGGGNDVLTGGNGDDTLWGSEGNDVLNGGSGKDNYEFRIWFRDGVDVITGFNPTEDQIGFLPVIDGSIPHEQIAFVNNKLALHSYGMGYGYTGNDLSIAGIYLDTSNGNLWYNPTTFWWGDSIHFATIDLATVVGGINSVSVDDFSLISWGLL